MKACIFVNIVLESCVSDPFHLHGLTGRTVGHRSIGHRFKPQLGYIRMIFHLSPQFITIRQLVGSFGLPCAQKVAVKQQHLHFCIDVFIMFMEINVLMF